MAKKNHHETYDDTYEDVYKAPAQEAYQDEYEEQYDDPYAAADLEAAEDVLAEDYDDDFDLDDPAVALSDAAPRTGFRVAAGVFDFVGVAVCTVLILGLIVIMGNLYQWLRQDLNSTFAGIGKNINEAVVVDAHKNQ